MKPTETLLQEFREKFTEPMNCEEDCCGAKELCRFFKDTPDTVSEVETFLLETISSTERRKDEEWQEKVKKILTCPNSGYAHYCPNCSNKVGSELLYSLLEPVSEEDKGVTETGV